MLRFTKCSLTALTGVQVQKLQTSKFLRVSGLSEVIRRNYAGNNSKKPSNLNKQVLTPPSASKDPPKNNLWIYGLAASVVAGGIAWYLFNNNKSGSKAGAAAQLPVKRIPLSPADIPKEIPYLLIGGGTASFTAFRAIKSHEPKAKVLLISQELEVPYMRPPLSKEMWFNEDPAVVEKLRFKQWNGAERSLFYEPTDFYVEPDKLIESVNGGVAVCRGWRVTKLNVCDNVAVLDDGTEIKYGKCLIATGARPKNLPVFEVAPAAVKEKISFFKGVDDYVSLKKVVDASSTIAIIGGGFLGSELACALANYGQKKQLEVFQVFHESGNMGKVLPEYLSKWTTEQVEEVGVKVISNTQIKAAENHGRQLKLTLNDGRTLLVDHAVVAVGSEPDTELAKESKLEVHPTLGGYVVNPELEARSNVFVAGDAACFFDPLLGRRRIEHHDHAVVSGRLAGENMVGLKKPYTHQSMFWSDLGPKVGYEAIGLVDASLPTTAVFAKSNKEDSPVASNMEDKLQVKPETAPESAKVDEKVLPKKSESENDFGKGVVFYLNEKDRVVGVLLWNLFNRIGVARKIVSQDTKYEDLNELAKLFDIHEQHPN